MSSNFMRACVFLLALFVSVIYIFRNQDVNPNIIKHQKRLETEALLIQTPPSPAPTRQCALPAITQEANAGRGSVTYVCESSSSCGGLADRVRGISAAYMYALMLNRSFHISMPNMHLEEFLQPRLHAWNIPAPSPASKRFVAIDDVRTLDLCEWQQHLHLEVATNQWTPGAFLHADCPEWHTQHARELLSALFTAPPTAQHYIKEFPCIGSVFNLLFEPTEQVLNALRIERQRVPAPSIGIHFREGDIAMLPGQSDQRGRSFDLCMAEARRAVSPATVYVVSDSWDTKMRVANETDVLISPAVPFHVDKSVYERLRVLELFVDLFMLASMDAIVITPSGFGALAATMGAYTSNHIHYC